MEILSVYDEAFREYGKVLDCFDCAELLEAMEKIPMPAAGVSYEPAIDSLEACKVFADFRDRGYGGMPIEIGMCWGYNTKLNCLEYHRDSEINLGLTDFVLLLARQGDIVDGVLDTATVKAFKAPAGVPVEVYATSLHYAPCRVEGGFKVVVVLPCGTNTEKPDYTPTCEEDKWMTARNNNIDMVVGPIENYTDALFGTKAAHEAFILIKDQDWTQQLARYVAFLPELQRNLPVPEEYKKETPGADADLAVYDAVYYAGDCNANSKTIAINLPNDERVQLEKGTRKLQLKNAMKAKFDAILVPIAEQLMTPESMKNIKFDAFFANVMFHETAHGMGIKNTLDGKGTVRAALKEQYSAIEEAKADVLGLYLITKLSEMGEYTNTELEDNYATFMAGIFRSVRFGASSAHGKANMLTFNYFQREGAFTRNENGQYAINFDAMKLAVEKLAGDILVHQGNGDYEGVKSWIDEDSVIKGELQGDLDRVNEAGVPVDIYYNMGPQVLLGQGE